MPVCHRCGRYYTKHAILCPSCFPVLKAERFIRHAEGLPAVGDTWVDGETKESFRIEAVSIGHNGVVTLTLSDGSLVDSDVRALVLTDPVPTVSGSALPEVPYSQGTPDSRI